MTDPIQRLNDLRQKVLNEEELTTEEVKEATLLLRSQRRGIGGEETKPKAVPMNLNDLF